MEQWRDSGAFGIAAFFLAALWISNGSVLAVESDEAFRSGILSHLIHPNDPVLPSPILGQEWAKVTAQIYAEMPADMKKKFPEGMNEEKFKAELLKHFQTAPCVMVTASEETDFKAGKFDDARNTATLKRFKDLLTSLKVDLPLPEQIFFREFDAGKLSGVRLEVAVRSAFMTAGKIQAALGKK